MKPDNDAISKWATETHARACRALRLGPSVDGPASCRTSADTLSPTFPDRLAQRNSSAEADEDDKQTRCSRCGRSARVYQRAIVVTKSVALIFCSPECWSEWLRDDAYPDRIHPRRDTPQGHGGHRLELL